MGLRDRIRKRALKLGTRAFGALMADEKRAEQVGRAIGAAQRGKEALDKAQGQLLHALGFAAREDYLDLVRRAAALNERLDALERKLGDL